MKYLGIYRPAERNAPPSQVTQSSEFTQAVTPAVHAKVSKKRMWTGGVISILVALLLLFDSFGLLTNPTPRSGGIRSARHSRGPEFRYRDTRAGVYRTLCDPRTSVLGAIRPTGYLGSASAVNLRVSDPLFETLFGLCSRGNLGWDFPS
jgi:hypothetical protein